MMKICKKRNLIILLSIIIVIAVCSLYLLFKPKPIPELPDYPFFHIDWNAKRTDGIISYAEEVSPSHKNRHKKGRKNGKERKYSPDI